MRSSKPYDRPKFAAASKRLQDAASSSEPPELDPAAAAPASADAAGAGASADGA